MTRRAEYTHRDLNTDMSATVLVMTDDESSGRLAPNPDQCPLCLGAGSITVREGSLPRDDKGDIDYPLKSSMPTSTASPSYPRTPRSM
jgi:hypothetical protein